MKDPTWWLLTARLGSALGLGIAIGLERQWRSRSAGLRTTALVSTGAAMFVLMSVLTDREASPTRVAAQVVSGIGFLGAGVIIREGGSLRGINTAATIWCAAAVGCLSAAGHLGAAGAGTGAVIATNLLLRPVALRIDRRVVSAPGRHRDYLLRAVCRDEDEAQIRALLVHALPADLFTLHEVRSRDLEDTGRVEVTARLTAAVADPGQLEDAVSMLSLQPGITAVSWQFVSREPDEEDDV
ncbi:membrane protein [Longispora fulva]|uniref:Putative Mg2+ transporter-C (MgtC) family protein n=1 Tax=Longispora fulva TaxID=619741 RepID=A0A8J7KUC3_9ACTN|nr:MgtC/SapB family protein [Longispora fulva]MBG6141687.1 putative Mg2+ transporter-C (MgtC) family protein [Longispora fulva]GIG59158.1 membrane protein [Longispora fulva]